MIRAKICDLLLDLCDALLDVPDTRRILESGGTGGVCPGRKSSVTAHGQPGPA